MKRVCVALSALFLLFPLLVDAELSVPRHGLIAELRNGSLILVVSGHSFGVETRASQGLRILETFTVPEDVMLRSRVFKNRGAIEQYLLHAYVSAIPVPEPPPFEPPDLPDCSDTRVGQLNDIGISDGSQVNNPPRIFIVLPTSGPAFMPIAIGGTNFARGTIPYVNGTPSISLFNFSTRNIPLIGSISVGFTIVPPAAPSGPGDIVVEYQCLRSNPFPFTKN